ncbi:glycosyltransferase family 39 protein [Streptomyces californicus]|uniref:glycosyltransferase family 39 protein n=1 Tax=Streptomyces californicus TaxID=67351 RepID=UPI0036C2BCDE
MAALALGFWGIRRQDSLWSDEAVTYEVAHRSTPDIARLLAEADVVHGLHYFLMHAVFALWEGGTIALRLPSVLAVAATAAGVGLLGRRLAGPRAGLFAGLVLALLPSMQRYAQEGRSYALVCALLTWGTWLLLDALDSDSRKRWPRCGGRRPGLGGRCGRRCRWAGYGAVMLVACLVHAFAVLGLVAHGVTAALSRTGLRPWATTASVVSALLAPLALVSATQSGQVSWIAAPAPSDLVDQVVVFAVGVACALLLRRGRIGSGTPAAVGVPVLALPLLLLPAGLLLAFSPLRALYVERYVLYGSIGLALLIGAALDRALLHVRALPHVRVLSPLGGPRLPVLVVAVATALVTLAVLPASRELRTPASRSDDVTAVAEAVREVGAAGDGLVFLPARRAWVLATPDAYAELDDLALADSPAASGTLFGTEFAPAVIQDRLTAHRRVVAVRDVFGEPRDSTGREAAKEAALRARFVECGTRRVTRAQITVYARPGHC